MLVYPTGYPQGMSLENWAHWMLVIPPIWAPNMNTSNKSIVSKPWLRCWGDVIWTGERVTVTFSHCLRVDGDTLHTSARRAQRRRWAKSQRCMASQIHDHTVILGSFAGGPHIHHTCPWCHGKPWKVLEEKRRPVGGMRSCEMSLPYGECTQQRPTCAVWFARRISGCLALSPAVTQTHWQRPVVCQ